MSHREGDTESRQEMSNVRLRRVVEHAKALDIPDGKEKTGMLYGLRKAMCRLLGHTLLLDAKEIRCMRCQESFSISDYPSDEL